MMDQVGLDTVQHIEEHYIKDRKLPTSHLDWLEKNYIDQNKLGKKSDNGGLYPPPKKGESTRLLLLNVGLAEPLAGKSIKEIQHSGQLLSLNASEPGARATQLVGDLPAPDGIDVAKSTNRIYWTNMGNPKNNDGDRKSTRLNSSHSGESRMPSSA